VEVGSAAVAVGIIVMVVGIMTIIGLELEALSGKCQLVCLLREECGLLAVSLPSRIRRGYPSPDASTDGCE
jgi:hypothetical protein